MIIQIASPSNTSNVNDPGEIFWDTCENERPSASERKDIILSNSAERTDIGEDSRLHVAWLIYALSEIKRTKWTRTEASILDAVH